VTPKKNLKMMHPKMVTLRTRLKIAIPKKVLKIAQKKNLKRPKKVTLKKALKRTLKKTLKTQIMLTLTKMPTINQQKKKVKRQLS